MLTELFNRMQFEPSILMFGKKYRSLSTVVLNYSWNSIVTTNCDLQLSVALDNGKRTIQEVSNKNDMQANLMDRKNLHVIRLFKEDVVINDIDELDAEDIADNAVAMLSRVSEIIQRNGVILIEDFDDPLLSHKQIRKALVGLYENQKQVYIFNCKNKDQYLTSLEKKGIAVLIEQSINDFFSDYFEDDYDIDKQDNNQNALIYIEAGKKAVPTRIETKYLIETDSFATLLNIDLLNSVKIPTNMLKDYFYMFLKNSVREPQWYGYSYGFNLHRSYEDRLYRKVKKGLESVGKPNSRPLLVVGQTGTGKSISLAAVAYKIFNEKTYPVIYMNDPDINFYLSAEYKQKGVYKKGSPAFSALDALLERLENLGAKATLIVWDTSSYSTGREKCYRLYQALLARGRKVYLVSSAYEMNENANSIDADDEYNEDTIMNRKFVECRATVEVSTEGEQLKEILLNKCHMDEQEASSIITSLPNSSNYLSMFYRAFDVIRGDLSQGVYREASANLKDLNKLLSTDIDATTFSNNVFSIALRRIEGDLVEAGALEAKSDNVPPLFRRYVFVGKEVKL